VNDFVYVSLFVGSEEEGAEEEKGGWWGELAEDNLGLMYWAEPLWSLAARAGGGEPNLGDLVFGASFELSFCA